MRRSINPITGEPLSRWEANRRRLWLQVHNANLGPMLDELDARRDALRQKLDRLTFVVGMWLQSGALDDHVVYSDDDGGPRMSAIMQRTGLTDYLPLALLEDPEIVRKINLYANRHMDGGMTQDMQWKGRRSVEEALRVQRELSDLNATIEDRFFNRPEELYSELADLRRQARLAREELGDRQRRQELRDELARRQRRPTPKELRKAAKEEHERTMRELFGNVKPFV